MFVITSISLVQASYIKVIKGIINQNRSNQINNSKDACVVN